MTNYTIKAIANPKNRTFLLQKTFKDGSFTKYKTFSFNRKEFSSMQYYTSNDWQYFLNRSESYFLLK